MLKMRYMKRLITATFGFLTLGWGGFIVQAETIDHHYPNVVELFTSQGCSSCPPADLVLKSYSQREDVIALSYAVDYWDYLGWRDTFGKAAHSQRQRKYALSRGDGQVYTPQAVVNGVAHVNGAHKALIEQEMKKSEKLLSRRHVGIRSRLAGRTIQVELEGLGAPNDGVMILWLLRVKDVGTVRVKRGENGGRELSYYNVVLQANKAATLKEAKTSLTLQAPEAPLATDEQFVLLLQEGETGPIIGAGRLR